MPSGILVNALSVIVGGGIGLVVKDRLDQDFKEKLNMIFGVCAMGMGVSTIVLMKNMPAVIFSLERPLVWPSIWETGSRKGRA